MNYVFNWKRLAPNAFCWCRDGVAKKDLLIKPPKDFLAFYPHHRPTWFFSMAVGWLVVRRRYKFHKTNTNWFMAFFAGLAKGLGSSWSWFFLPPPPGRWHSGFLNLSPTPQELLSVAGICSGVGLCLNLCLLSQEESFRLKVYSCLCSCSCPFPSSCTPFEETRVWVGGFGWRVLSL